MGETTMAMEATESVVYKTRHERLRSRIAKYCLPDQADKVIITVLSEIQGFNAEETYRHISNITLELASDNLGINP